MRRSVRSAVLGTAVVAAALAALGVLRVEDTSSSALAATGTGEAPDWRTQVSAFSDAHPQAVLPQRLPSDVQSVTGVLVDGQPALDVHTDRGPSVTVCAGEVAVCRAALPDNPVVRTGTARGVPYVVSVNPTEDPARPPELGDAAAFWSTVSLDTARPPWLVAASDSD